MAGKLDEDLAGARDLLERFPRCHEPAGNQRIRPLIFLLGPEGQIKRCRLLPQSHRLHSQPTPSNYRSRLRGRPSQLANRRPPCHHLMRGALRSRTVRALPMRPHKPGSKSRALRPRFVSSLISLCTPASPQEWHSPYGFVELTAVKARAAEIMSSRLRAARSPLALRTSTLVWCHRAAELNPPTTGTHITSLTVPTLLQWSCWAASWCLSSKTIAEFGLANSLV